MSAAKTSQGVDEIHGSQHPVKPLSQEVLRHVRGGRQMKRNAYMTFSDWDGIFPRTRTASMMEHGATTTAERGHEATDADPWSRMHREVLVRARRGLVGTQSRQAKTHHSTRCDEPEVGRQRQAEIRVSDSRSRCDEAGVRFAFGLSRESRPRGPDPECGSYEPSVVCSTSAGVGSHRPREGRSGRCLRPACDRQQARSHG